MLDPELYLAGYTLSDTTILSQTGDDIELDWGYDSDAYQKLKDVFDAQAKWSDLIFSSGTGVLECLVSRLPCIHSLLCFSSSRR